MSMYIFDLNKTREIYMSMILGSGPNRKWIDPLCRPMPMSSWTLCNETRRPNRSSFKHSEIWKYESGNVYRLYRVGGPTSKQISNRSLRRNTSDDVQDREFINLAAILSHRQLRRWDSCIPTGISPNKDPERSLFKPFQLGIRGPRIAGPFSFIVSQMTYEL